MTGDSRTTMAYRRSLSRPYVLDSNLKRGSDLHLTLRRLCAAEQLICGAERCGDRKLKVIPEGPGHGAYFSHISKHHDQGLRAGPAESEGHQRSKQLIVNQALAAGWTARYEVRLEDECDSEESLRAKPDLVLEPPSGGKPWAIEVQYSRISPEDLHERTRKLERLGFRVCWVWGVRNLPRPGADGFTRIDAYQAGPGRRFENIWVTGPVNNEPRIAQAHSVDWRLEAEIIRGRRPLMPNALDLNWNWPIELDPTHDASAPWTCPDLEDFLARLRVVVTFEKPLANAERRRAAACGEPTGGVTDPAVWAVWARNVDLEQVEARLKAEAGRIDAEAAEREREALQELERTRAEERAQRATAGRTPGDAQTATSPDSYQVVARRRAQRDRKWNRVREYENVPFNGHPVAEAAHKVCSLDARFEALQHERAWLEVRSEAQINPPTDADLKKVQQQIDHTSRERWVAARSASAAGGIALEAIRSELDRLRRLPRPQTTISAADLDRAKAEAAYGLAIVEHEANPTGDAERAVQQAWKRLRRAHAIAEEWQLNRHARSA